MHPLVTAQYKYFTFLLYDLLPSVMRYNSHLSAIEPIILLTPSERPSVSLSVPSIDSSSGVRRVCCLAPRVHRSTAGAGAAYQLQAR